MRLNFQFKRDFQIFKLYAHLEKVNNFNFESKAEKNQCYLTRTN